MEENPKTENSAVHEIKKKFRLAFLVMSFVIITLFSVIIRYSLAPLRDYLSFIPDLSISLILGIVLVLTILGLFLSYRIAQQVVRIIKDYAFRIERILTVTSDLREEIHGDILLEKILDAAISITRSDAGSLIMLDQDKLVFKIAKGEKSAGLPGTVIESNRGIAGWVAANGCAVRVTDVAKDERFSTKVDSLTGYETKSILCVPLKTKSGVLGVLELLNRKEGRPYRERDEEFIKYLAEQAAISIVKTKFVEDQKNYEIHVTEMLMEAIDCHTPEKKGHSRRVARYANIIAKALEISEAERKRLYFACLLHDVGFLKINSDNIFKREEFMKHPEIGYEMIYPINFYSDIAPFIRHHHERFDGFGYPGKLKESEIPLQARIISIAEAFDVMTSQTTYKVPINVPSALEELKKHSGSQFDPELVELFLRDLEMQYTKI